MIFSLRSLLQSLTFLLLCSLVATLPVQAETKVLTAEATYTMGDGESPSFAEAMVLQKAKQMALEQAGTYVESYTKIKNYDLTHEEIQTIAGGVLQVETLEKTRTLIGDGLRFYVKIKATVTTDKMAELAQRIKGKNVAEEYKKLQEDYARLSKEIEGLKQLIARTPTGPDRETVLDQIREREKAFASVQRRETAFYQHLFSGEAILAEAAGQLSKKQAHKEILEGLMQWIMAHGYRITHQRPSVITSIKKPGRATVTIPVSVALTTEAKGRIVQVAEQLGGNVSALRQSTPKTMCGKDTVHKLPTVAFPVVLSQDFELLELFLDLVNSQVLEISARRADGTIIFEKSQELISQRVNGRDCPVDPGRNVAPFRVFYLQSAPTNSKPLVAPIFSYAPPTLEELYLGFEDIISRGRTKNKSNSDILKDINSEIEGIKRTSPELSAEQIAEISAGCRTLSGAYQAARDEERRLYDAQFAAWMGALNRNPIAAELARQHAMDSMRKDDDRLKKLKTIKKKELSLLFKQPLKKPCRQPENLENFASQVFLLNAPTHTTFVIDLPLESISVMQDVQARVILEPESQ